LVAAASEEQPWRRSAADSKCVVFNGSNAFYDHVSGCWSHVQLPAGAKCGGVFMTEVMPVSAAIKKPQTTCLGGSCELHGRCCVLQDLIYLKSEMVPSWIKRAQPSAPAGWTRRWINLLGV